MNNKNSDIPNEFSKLIPWFFTGKLSEDDQVFFEKSLTSDPSLQKQLEIEQQLISIVTADASLLNKSAIASQEERLKSVFNMIDAKEPEHNLEQHNQPKAFTSLSSKLKKTLSTFIPPSNFGTQYTNIACASALIVSVAILTTVFSPQLIPTSDFMAASADIQTTNDQMASTETALLVGFNGTLEELANNDVFKGKRITIKSTPENKDFFQISIKQTMNADEIKQTIHSLLAQKEKVWFAGEAF